MIPKKHLNVILENIEPWNETNGRTWYADAKREIEKLANTYGRTVETVTGIVAVLSPGCKWSSNIADAEEVLKYGSDAVVTTYGANKEKAVRILNGETFETVANRNKRTGRKVRAFYDNLLNPETSNAVTIDRWIIRAVYGKQDEKIERSVFASNLYEKLSGIIADAARARDLRPHELQAMVWLQIRDDF